MPDSRFVVQGPTPRDAVVQAWAADYIRFDRRPPWQDQLRDEVRSRCVKLEPTADQILHATFFGTKLPNADVENLAIYNIGSFREAGANGIRFELSDTVPAVPDGADFSFAYRYELVSHASSFNHWRTKGSPLASFDWIDLGKFTGEKKLAQVWQAIAASVDKVEVARTIEPETPFAVRLQVRPPHGRKPVWGGLVKGVFDGVICALQAHSGPVPTEVVKRLAKQLWAEPKDIMNLLGEPRWDVLGRVPALVSGYRSGVKWNPSDHLCVAGELIAAESQPGDGTWAIKGEVIELAS